MTTQYDQPTTTRYEATMPADETKARATTQTRTGHEVTYASDKTWKTWPDWVNVILGVVLVITPMVAAAAPTAWFVTLGLIAAAVGLIGLGTASAKGWEITQMVVGAIVFLAPWIGGFAAAGGVAWTAWIVGLALIVFAAVAMNQGTKYVR